MVTNHLPRNKHRMKKETMTAKTIKIGKLMFHKLKKQIDYICNELTYSKLKNMKNRFRIITIMMVPLSFVISGYAQQDIPITGSNNIAQSLKASLSSIPNLKVGNISCNISNYGLTQITPTNTSFYLEGAVTIDYFDITMSDGKVIRFTQDGQAFSCGINDYPATVDGPRRHDFKPYAYVNFNGKTELGSVSDPQGKYHINFTSKTFKHIWGSQQHNNDISPIRSISVNCLGIDNYTLDDLKKRVQHLRETYDALKKQQNNSQTQNNSSSNNRTNQQNNSQTQNNSTFQQPDAYQKAQQDIKNTFDQWHQNRMEEEEEDDGSDDRERQRKTVQQMNYLDWDISFDGDAGSVEEQYNRKKAEEREWEELERKRAEAARIAKSRTSILDNLPKGSFPTSATRAESNKFYYFFYAYNGSSMELVQSMQVSNVFAVGQFPDKTWPLKSKIEEEIKQIGSYSTKYIVGHFLSEPEALAALNNFKNNMASSGIEMIDIQYSGKNANVETIQNSQSESNLDFWGNPVKKENNPKGNHTPTQPKQEEKKKQKLDFWGNPIKE